MAISLATAQTQLDAWLSASIALSTGKEHWMNGRKIVQEDADNILDMIKFWEARVDSISNPNSSGVGITVGNWN